MTWGTPVQSFIFLGLLVFELEPMYATSDGRTTDADHRIMPPRRGHNKRIQYVCVCATDSFILIVNEHKVRGRGVW